METQNVVHQTINGKYRVLFEKAASANKVDGFKVEVNGDSMADVTREAMYLYDWATRTVEATKPIPAPEPKKKE